MRATASWSRPYCITSVLSLVRVMVDCTRRAGLVVSRKRKIECATEAVMRFPLSMNHKGLPAWPEVARAKAVAWAALTATLLSYHRAGSSVVDGGWSLLASHGACNTSRLSKCSLLVCSPKRWLPATSSRPLTPVRLTMLCITPFAAILQAPRKDFAWGSTLTMAAAARFVRFASDALGSSHGSVGRPQSISVARTGSDFFRVAGSRSGERQCTFLEARCVRTWPPPREHTGAQRCVCRMQAVPFLQGKANTLQT